VIFSPRSVISFINSTLYSFLKNSTAFSLPGCSVPGVDGTIDCHTNNYTYQLMRCQDCVVPGVATHNAGQVCQQQTSPVVLLEYCSAGRVPTSYLCVITGGPSPVTEDAFIEWFYYFEVNNTATSYMSGKFTFSASAEYIKFWSHDGVDYTNSPSGSGVGIPMFVQPSHNQI
jgi:hypothetical protein